MKEEWSQFDADARREADRILDRLLRAGAENGKRELLKLGDGGRKRSLVRMIARSEGEHLAALDIVKVLEGETKQTAPVIVHAGGAFTEALQVCLDLLFDARQGPARGKLKVVLQSLLHGLVDELLVAFHLAQRAFVTQAYAHVRSVEEVLDAAEVFIGDAALLDRWLDASSESDEKKIFFELRKAAKTKLGSGTNARLYAFLSALGPHAQLRGLQARAAISGRTATFFILGSTA
jgi:hypothetical protein